MIIVAAIALGVCVFLLLVLIDQVGDSKPINFCVSSFPLSAERTKKKGFPFGERAVSFIFCFCFFFDHLYFH